MSWNAANASTMEARPAPAPAAPRPLGPPPPQPAAAPSVCRIIASDEITIERRIAGGGFGEVFLGRLDGELVAVKRLRVELGAQVLALFLKEAGTWARLSDPNVLQLIGIVIDGEHPAMVSKFMANGNVSDYLRKNRGGMPKMKVRVMRDISRAMRYLHSRNPRIVHTDLKALNVLVDEQGRALVTDFGFAAVRQTTAMGTAGKMVPGTFAFMPPERHERGVVNDKGDVYAYGMTSYEIWTGTFPYGTIPESALLLDKITRLGFRPTSMLEWEETPDELKAIVAAMPAGLLQLIEECWHADPKKRPSFEEIVPRIEAILDSVAPEARLEDEAASAAEPAPFQQRDSSYHTGGPKVDMRVAREEVERAVREAEERLRAEMEARVRMEMEARVRAEAEARIRAEVEARARAEAEARVRAETEERVRREMEARMRAELEAKERELERAKRDAEAQLRVEHEALERRREADAAQAQAEAEHAKVEAEQARLEAEKKARSAVPDPPKGLPAEKHALWKSAHQGDAESQFQIGWLFHNGTGVTKDHVQAVMWYRKAADQGHAWGQHNLGCCYRDGEGVAKDHAQAAAWFRKAADQGNALGQNSLGMRHLNGEGVAKDHAQAAAWFRKAADQGDADGQVNLGLRYLIGEGVAKDHAQAAAWFRKAADQGNALGQNSLGVRYLNGEGVAKDHAQAAAWFRKAADQGNASGQVNLGVRYLNGEGVAKDHAQAAAWFRKAADQGNATGQNNLAHCYENGFGVPRDIGQAVALYRKSADKGIEFAINALKRLGYQ